MKAKVAILVLTVLTGAILIGIGVNKLGATTTVPRRDIHSAVYHPSHTHRVRGV